MEERAARGVPCNGCDVVIGVGQQFVVAIEGAYYGPWHADCYPDQLPKGPGPLELLHGERREGEM